MSIHHGAKLGTTKARGMTWGGIKAKGISEILVLRDRWAPCYPGNSVGDELQLLVKLCLELFFLSSPCMISPPQCPAQLLWTREGPTKCLHPPRTWAEPLSQCEAG